MLQLLEGVGPVTARRVLDALVSALGDRARRPGRAGARAPPDGARAAGGRARRCAAEARPRTGGAGVQAERLRDALAPLITAATRTGPSACTISISSSPAARESSDLGHFAAELALDPPQSSADLAGPPHLDEDYLVLSTIHSAKGLEWDGVHVLALYDGNFPACMSAGSSERSTRSAACCTSR